MAQFIDKAAVAEIKDLYEDIDKCIGNLVLARSKHDQRGISDAHWKMETLMVNTQQVLSYILQHLEVKEVDLNIEEELKKYGISSPKTREICIASHFYELGLKAKEEKRKYIGHVGGTFTTTTK